MSYRYRFTSNASLSAKIECGCTHALMVSLLGGLCAYAMSKLSEHRRFPAVLLARRPEKSSELPPPMLFPYY